MLLISDVNIYCFSYEYRGGNQSEWVSAHGLEKAAKVDILNSVKTTDNLSQEKAANLLEIEELAS